MAVKKKSKTRKVQPSWMKTAISLIGTKEKPGKGNNPEIMAWATVLGGKVAKVMWADSVPWCGLGVAYSLAANGIKPVDAPLWARNWAKFGRDLQKSGPCYGAIMVFKRGRSSGHVGFYVSEDRSYYHILGFNQSDSVNVMRIAKKRCIAWRFPSGAKYQKYYKPGRIVRKFRGKISANEA